MSKLVVSPAVGSIELGLRILGNMIFLFPALWKDYQASQDLFDIGSSYGKMFSAASGYYI